MKFSFQKWHGCGNDYIFMDFALSGIELPSDFPNSQLIQALSNRDRGVGSDGLILLLPSKEAGRAHVRMRMFNADGSEAEMCGNGLRCLAAIVKEQKPEIDEVVIETAAGLRSCKILSGDGERYQIRANMGRPTFLPANIPVLFEDVMVIDEAFEVGGREFRVSCLSMGNPHCVIEVKDLESFEVEKFGPLIEKHEAFPDGINVEFIERNSDDLVFQRTWERGSGETKACGTGACAVGVSLLMRKRVDSPVDIQLKGGRLKVFWDGLREVFLEGEAVREKTGELEWDPAQPSQFKIL